MSWLLSNLPRVFRAVQFSASQVSRRTRAMNVASNIEIKARIQDPDKLKTTALSLADTNEFDVLEQVDTFFNCQHGRLKLRETINRPDAQGMLVAYERIDKTGPKQSDFSITLIPDSDKLKVTLGMALGVRGIVKKIRTLVMIDQTKVHIDEVEGLGNFMELEVVLKDGQTAVEGTQIAQDLMDKLSVHQSDLISGAYMDLLEK